jgi:hypothetical protein
VIILQPTEAQHHSPAHCTSHGGASAANSIYRILPPSRRWCSVPTSRYAAAPRNVMPKTLLRFHNTSFPPPPPFLRSDAAIRLRQQPGAVRPGLRIPGDNLGCLDIEPRRNALARVAPLHKVEALAVPNHAWLIRQRCWAALSRDRRCHRRPTDARARQHRGDSDCHGHCR